jgi:hypothetical protein
MRRTDFIAPLCVALFATVLLIFIIAADRSTPSMVWWAYLLPLFVFALAAFSYVQARVKRELSLAMQGQEAGESLEQQPQRELYDEAPAPPPLTVELWPTASRPPEGAGATSHLARIEEFKSSITTELRAAVRILAWYGVAIATLGVLAPARYSLGWISWLGFIVTLFVTRRRRKDMFLNRVGVLSLLYWFWIFTLAVSAVSYLGATVTNYSHLDIALKPFGLSLVCVIALVSAHRRRQRRTLRQQDEHRARHNLLFLWVFKSGGSAWFLFNGLAQEWAAIGRTRLLGGGEFLGTHLMSPRLLWSWLRGRAGELMVHTPQDLDSKLELQKRKDVAIETYLCHDRVWKMALDRLLSDSSLVLMNLSGLSKSNRGCLYELDLIFHRVRLSRVVFLIDQQTEFGDVEALMQDVWQRLAADSLNRLGQRPTVWVVQLATSMAELEERKNWTVSSGSDSEDVTLQAAQAMSRFAETDRVVRILCTALARYESEPSSLPQHCSLLPSG